MAVQLLMLGAKAGALAKKAGPLLAAWKRLEPEARRQLQAEAGAVTTNLNLLRRALGARLFDNQDDEEISWEEARQYALNPPADFKMARRLVDIVVDRAQVSEGELRGLLGAVGERDSVFASALQLAMDDGYIAKDPEGVWHVTDFADRELVDSEHVRFIESAVVDYVQEVGLAGRDQLAVDVGAPDFHSDEFQAAVERAIVSGAIEWLGPGMYGLPQAELATHEPPEQEIQEAPKVDRGELTELLGDLKHSIERLQAALTKGRAPRPSDSPQPALLAGDPVARLTQLKQLLDAGIISAEEFATKKTEILGEV